MSTGNTITLLIGTVFLILGMTLVTMRKINDKRNHTYISKETGGKVEVLKTLEYKAFDTGTWCDIVIYQKVYSGTICVEDARSFYKEYKKYNVNK